MGEITAMAAPTGTREPRSDRACEWAELPRGRQTMRRAGEGGDGEHTRHCCEHNPMIQPFAGEASAGLGVGDSSDKRGSDPGLMRSWRWSGQGFLVGTAEYGHVGTWASVPATTGEYCTLGTG